MLVLILVGVMAALAGVLLWMLEQRYSMWRSRGVPGPVASIFSPAIPKTLLGQENMGDIADRTYRDYHDHPVAGTYLLTTPVLHLHDPEVIKQVLIKEFQDFNGRGVVAEADWDPLTSHLFFISGQRWRNLRVKLAPTFTTGKIKYMFNTIRQSSEQLADYLAEKVVAGGGSHVEDARLLMMRLFVDTIASVAFGIESNTVKDPANSEFFKAAHEAVEPSRSNALRAVMSFFARDLMRWLRIKGVTPATDKFFRNVVRETVEYREQNNVERADMLNLLIQLKNKGYVAADNGESPAKEDGGNKERITQDEIAAQVFIFFVAGFESSSSTTSFTLYEMAKNPAIYDKAVKEIDQVLKEHNGEITYDAIMALPYLERAINETLRMYPPLAFITREAMVSRQVPGTEVVVDKGTRVVVPIRALHYDPQYWPEPEKYDPDRFTDENKSTRPSSVYMPFGEGPRMCIAARLGVVQVKTALVTLLSRYRVSPCPGAKSKVKLNPRSFATTPSGDLNVRFHPRVAAA